MSYPATWSSSDRSRTWDSRDAVLCPCPQLGQDGACWWWRRLCTFRAGVHENSAASAQFCCEPKTAQGNKVLEKTNYVSKSGIKCHIKASSSISISSCWQELCFKEAVSYEKSLLNGRINNKTKINVLLLILLFLNLCSFCKWSSFLIQNLLDYTTVHVKILSKGVVAHLEGQMCVSVRPESQKSHVIDIWACHPVNQQP